jgi:(2R)-ethylmalonyl-CoA mutase
MEVVYGGIRLTPRQIAESARDEDPDVIGLSILSGSHLALVPEVLRELNSLAVLAPVIVGGIIPDEDRDVLISAGVAAVYTPKDYAVSRIMDDIVQIVERHRASHSDN